MPKPKIAMGTRKSQYDPPPMGHAKSAKPSAAIAGPMIRGPLALKRSSNPPPQRDSRPMISVKGRNAAPARNAENPSTWMSAKGRKKNPPPPAPQKKREDKGRGGGGGGKQTPRGRQRGRGAVRFLPEECREEQ